MSNKNNPRVLRLKNYPKGIFKWKVTFQLTRERTCGSYGRYYDEYTQITPAVLEYLRQNTHGKYSLHEIIRKQFEKGFHKYDYVLFEHKLDVTLFKLVHGSLIRRIYEIKVE